jgi:outer membrane receptor protein involved in Fe transport
MKNSLLAILIILSITTYAHDAGSVIGNVTDTKSEMQITGAVIRIQNTLIGTTSNINGNYELRNIQIGSYTLICSLIGYKPEKIEIKIYKDKTDTINFNLDESIVGIDEVTVQGTRPVSAASSQEIRAIDMQLKPVRSTQDMLLMVPGLFIAQHQGGGKAEQIFLRGFDCDHGTDVSINVDNMPDNLPTHAHGQGYADLHFLIAETVDKIEVNKGPYLPDFGDFYTAGAVSFKTKDVLDNNLFKIEGGQFNTQKYTFMYQPDNGGKEQNGYLATQFFHSDGPFKNPENFQRMNFFGKYFFQLTHNSKLTFSFSGFTTGWNASGQIPERAVNEGTSRFGFLDPNEGGSTDRENINIAYNFLTRSGNEFETYAYMSNYNFKLFSDFTYFLVDSVNGDMIEQTEHRSIRGVNSTYKFASDFMGIKIINKISCGYRGDDIALQLWHSPNRIRMNVFTNDVVDEQNLFTWAEQEYVFSPRIRMVWGIRQDLFTFTKNDLVNNALDSINNGLPHASGTAYKSVFSPKVNFILSPERNLDLFLNFGQGFHSNDARDVVIGQTISNLTSTWKQDGMNNSQIDAKLQKYNFDPSMHGITTLPKATAGEIGMQTKLFDKLHLSLAAWYLYLQKEFVYSGDGGTTELSKPTQRIGFDAEARYSIFSWLWFDADVSYAYASELNLPKDSDYVPLAPRFVASGGLSVLRSNGFSGAFRFRSISDRPGDEANKHTAYGYTIFNANLAYKYKQFIFSVNCENIFNVDWNEAQFETTTRLKGEKTPVTDICFTPGNPRNFQFGISYSF